MLQSRLNPHIAQADHSQDIEDFRRLHGKRPARSKLISMKVPEDLLSAFKAKAKMNNMPYQTQIKVLMRDWVLDQSKSLIR